MSDPEPMRWGWVREIHWDERDLESAPFALGPNERILHAERWKGFATKWVVIIAGQASSNDPGHP